MLTGSLLQITSFVSNYLTLNGTLVDVVNTIVYAVIISLLIVVFDYTFGWIERKVIAKIHKRHGPTYAGNMACYRILRIL